MGLQGTDKAALGRYRMTQPHNTELPYGLVVRIPGFHPGGPGSIPGVGTDTIFFVLLMEVAVHFVTFRKFVCSYYSGESLFRYFSFKWSDLFIYLGYWTGHAMHSTFTKKRGFEKQSPTSKARQLSWLERRADNAKVVGSTPMRANHALYFGYIYFAVQNNS